MKKLFTIAALVTLLFAGTAQAAPYFNYQRTIVPEADNSFDLGTTSPTQLRWRNLFLVNGDFTNSTTTNATTTNLAVSGCLSVDSPTFVVSCNTNRVGIGTTTPGETFSVEGQALASRFIAYTPTATSTFGIVQAAKGLALLPGYSFTTDTDTGMLSLGNNQLNFSTGGTERMQISSTGLVGIGGTPSTKLQVNHDGTQFRVQDTSSSNLADFIVNDSGDLTIANLTRHLVFTPTIGTAGFGVATATPWGLLSVNPNGITGPAFVVGSSTGTRLIVTNGGDVGVGTAAPLSRLHVDGGAFRLSSGANNVVMSVNTATDTLDPIQFTDTNTANANFHMGLTAATTGKGVYYIAHNSNAPSTRLFFGIDSTSLNRMSYEGSDLAFFSGAFPGTERIRFTSTGSVGIGTSTPFAKLAINPVAGDPVPFVIGSSTATRFIVDNAGNVGIGTANPAATLNENNGQVTVTSSGITRVAINSGANNTGFALAESGTSRYSVASYNGGNFTIYDDVNNQDRISITPSGDVGVGTTTSTAKFAVQDSAGVTVSITSPSQSSPSLELNPNFAANASFDIGTKLATQAIRLYGGTTYDNGPAFQIWPTGSSFQGMYFDAGTATGADIIFRGAPSGTTGMTIKQSTARVGVGTTSPWRTFSVAGTMANTGMTAATGGTNQDVCISTTGDFVNESTGTCVVSSREFKKDISDLDVSALEMVNKLRPVSFSMKENISSDYRDTKYGFIAEEVADIDPHFALYGNKGEARSLDDFALISVMVKAIQEQQEMIEGFTGTAKKQVQDNWQWAAIVFLAGCIVIQQMQLLKIKRKLH